MSRSRTPSAKRILPYSRKSLVNVPFNDRHLLKHGMKVKLSVPKGLKGQVGKLIVERPTTTTKWEVFVRSTNVASLNRLDLVNLKKEHLPSTIAASVDEYGTLPVMFSLGTRFSRSPKSVELSIARSALSTYSTSDLYMEAFLNFQEFNEANPDAVLTFKLLAHSETKEEAFERYVGKYLQLLTVDVVMGKFRKMRGMVSDDDGSAVYVFGKPEGGPRETLGAREAIYKLAIMFFAPSGLVRSKSPDEVVMSKKQWMIMGDLLDEHLKSKGYFDEIELVLFTTHQVSAAAMDSGSAYRRQFGDDTNTVSFQYQII